MNGDGDKELPVSHKVCTRNTKSKNRLIKTVKAKQSKRLNSIQYLANGYHFHFISDLTTKHKVKELKLFGLNNSNNCAENIAS